MEDDGWRMTDRPVSAIRHLPSSSSIFIFHLHLPSSSSIFIAHLHLPSAILIFHLHRPSSSSVFIFPPPSALQHPREHLPRHPACASASRSSASSALTLALGS